MSVSQPMMALFTAPPPATAGAGTAATAAGDAVADFAAVLAGQDPARIQAVLDQLGITDGGSELAADGKQLPESIQDWLGQLASLESVDGAALPVDPLAVEQALQGESDQWYRWLSESRLTLVDPATEETEAESELVDAESVEAQEDPISDSIVSLGLTEPTSETGDAGLAGSLIASQSQAGSANAAGAESTTDGASDMTIGEDQRKGSSKIAAEASQLNQRANSVPLAASESVAFASKLAEQLEAGGKAPGSDNDSIDATSRPTLGSQSAAQSALTARPVAAPPQALGVPFGQQGWGEAMVEKVMWASSQNLRSVEIHLDPAELGPLEIHIQQRGQEQQVQFVSQNASVREALESQMYRLREMFAQQGMNQVNVSVGDSSAGQQSAREQFAGNRGGSGRTDDRAGNGMDGGDSIVTTAAAARVSAERLVDFYA
ncbi:flagellar hook-length control protein FliK [Halopseudomonas xinjiangensis]|uniref:Flagellar hook-length control protein FliK n=1 Tax=Halopseudomonas xinjiangensis TaxID=487184 RepID=A0A1H1MRM3_9GAMM|nr:flagellar hook-length control protein FliK [Halopseudomonas xinjiangensis]SDR89347.1 flagellar hook-length control protein FliK [Halopseudomonas xinjiangensis]